MSGVLLDTHTLIWLMEGNPRLGERSHQFIDPPAGSQDVFVSAISFWETAMLATRNRVALSRSVDLWRANVLALGIRELAIQGDTAISATQLENFHADPADRFIVATAIRYSLTLVTADEKILAWSGPLARQDARL